MQLNDSSCLGLMLNPFTLGQVTESGQVCQAGNHACSYACGKGCCLDPELGSPTFLQDMLQLLRPHLTIIRLGAGSAGDKVKPPEVTDASFREAQKLEPAQASFRLPLAVLCIRPPLSAEVSLSCWE